MADPVRSARPGANVAEFTVSELAGAIKRTLEGNYGHVRLRGEISGYRGPHSSGHCYFALKDDKSKVEAVIWRGVYGALRFKPEEGMEVIVTGKVSSFPGSSKYQIVIEALEPAGAGALMALLEERKKKFAAAGLFDESRKRPLPFLPRVVGIVTSPTGAVIRDMLHGFKERFPARVLIWPVRVQGETCAAEVAAAIRGFNALPEGGRIPRPDVLIVARGGGSLEDLWGFNEEIVVKAAAASKIPLISAVGHETDWTLIDLVADARAPTPTKAAEWAVPKYSELMEHSAKFGDRLRVGLRRRLEGARTESAERRRADCRSCRIWWRCRGSGSMRRRRGWGGRWSANSQAHAKRLARIAPRLQPRLIGVTDRAGGPLSRSALGSSIECADADRGGAAHAAGAGGRAIGAAVDRQPDRTVAGAARNAIEFAAGDELSERVAARICACAHGGRAGRAGGWAARAGRAHRYRVCGWACRGGCH